MGIDLNVDVVVDKNDIEKLFVEETSLLVVFEIKLTQPKRNKDKVAMLKIQIQLVRFSLVIE
jgi:hypothetical protein